MRRLNRLLMLAVGMLPAGMALAAGALEGVAEQQPLNVTAIIMFLVFVVATTHDTGGRNRLFRATAAARRPC